MNDTLLDLSSASMPAYIGGGLYVPYTMFNNGILGVYFSYDRTEQKASLLYGGRQIYFDMASGETFDAEGSSYSATAAYYNGRVYLPLDFICSFFGFSYAVISSEGLGTIVRVKDGNVVLSDQLFEQAARSLMRDRLNDYLGTDTPQASDPPTPDPEDEEDPDYTNIRVHLGFSGLDGAEDVLDLLATYGLTGSFFVTAGEIQAEPDLIRRILCAGHSLGIDLAREDDFAAAADLLFAAARYRTLLVSGGTGPVGSVQCLYDLDGAAEETDIYALRRGAAYAGGSFSAHFDCGGDLDTLAAFLAYLEAGQFAVRPFNELSGGSING